MESVDCGNILMDLCSKNVLTRDSSKKKLNSLIISLIQSDLQNTSNIHLNYFIQCSYETISSKILGSFSCMDDFYLLYGCLIYIKVLFENACERTEPDQMSKFENAFNYELWTELLRQIYANLNPSDCRNQLMFAEILSYCEKLKGFVTLFAFYLNSLWAKLDLHCKSLESNSSKSVRMHDNNNNNSETDSTESSCFRNSLDNTVNCLNILFSNGDQNDVELKVLVVPTMEKLLAHLFKSQVSPYIRDGAYRLFGNLTKFMDPDKECITRVINTGDGSYEWLSVCCDTLVKGMLDESNRVRLSACVATRQFFEIFNPYVELECVLSCFPAVCMNKNYSADGIKIQAIECWKLMTKDKGLDIVQNYIHYFLSFYQCQMMSSNMNAREAVIHCIAEIVSLVDVTLAQRDSLLVTKLSEMLAIGLRDHHWSVCDISIKSIGTLMIRFRSVRGELDEMIANDMVAMLFSYLTHTYQIIRCGAGLTLCRLLCVNPNLMFGLINKHLENNMKSIDKLPHCDDDRDSDADTGNIGCTKDKDDATLDVSVHRCDHIHKRGDLFPGLKLLGPYCGCLSREKEPWELTEGCIVLIGLLSFYFTSNSTKIFTNMCLSNYDEEFNDKSYCLDENLRQKLIETCNTYMPFVVECMLRRDFSNNIYLIETIFDFLPPMINFTDKVIFKRKFLVKDKIFDALNFVSSQADDDTKLITHIGDFVQNLSKLYGARIIQSMIQQFCPKHHRFLVKFL